MRVKPGRLFKYQPFKKQALDNLMRRHLWFAAPATFNDPFDCGVFLKVKEPTQADLRNLIDNWPATAGPRPDSPPYIDSLGRPADRLRSDVMNAAERAMRARVAETYWRRGVACFSECPDNLLMWAHYGGAQTGFCLEFDTSYPFFDRVHDVRYVHRIPELDAVRAFLEMDDESYLDMVLSKAWAWRYETEWRLIHLQANTAVEYGESLVAVHLGPSMSYGAKAHVAKLLDNAPVALFEVTCESSEFKLRTEQLSMDLRRRIAEQAPLLDTGPVA